MDSEINVIDYRGPETHAHNPPPNKSRNHPKIQRQSTVAVGKSKGQIYKAKKTVRLLHPVHLVVTFIGMVITVKSLNY